MWGEDDERIEKPALQIGEDLATISVEELQQRITLLEAEIERLRAEIEAKTATRAAAEDFFKG